MNSDWVLTSPDGIYWFKRNAVPDVYLRGITYGNDLFVGVGSNGTILISPDSINWTRQDPGTDNSLNQVSYGSDTFVVAGDNGTILTSPDGIYWTIQESGTYKSLRTTTYGNNTFVVAGNDGTILTSTGPIPPNMPPIANAGPDQVVFDWVTLDGSGSNDPDGTIEFYSWELVYRDRDHPEYDRTVDETPDPIVAVLDLDAGFYDVTLTVKDNDELTDTDTMLLAAAGQCVPEPPAPTISGICPAAAEPGTVVSLYGIGFGDTQGDSVVHVGGWIFDFTSSRIKVWSDTKIKIRIPFGAKPCEWFIHGDGQYRNRRVWMTVDGLDSNKKLLKVIKPDACP